MSTKTVFLYVSGGDYAALDFSRKYKVKEFYDYMIDREEREVIIDDSEMYAEVKIIEFDGEISEVAFEFIKDKMCDYDDLKACDMHWICIK